MATETNDLVEFIRSVPKAELHLHIEVRAWVCGAAAGRSFTFRAPFETFYRESRHCPRCAHPLLLLYPV